MIFGASVANDEILGFAKLFNDEITLHNISRPRLVTCTNIWESNLFEKMLTFVICSKKRLQWIKNDVDALLKMNFVKIVDEMRQQFFLLRKLIFGKKINLVKLFLQLCDWLDLSLNHSVSSSLLILSSCTE
uniref:Letm1 RBD domain-containing protein n=1 Tax=Lactuca sativa TaxID=4236 RepID=A0A9R1X643_LACSA|nr:hypothetical protein LSAT_V11C700376980 [Lactuca sativa]